MNKRCECGCGERVNTGRRFVHGHNHKGKTYSLSHKGNHAKAMRSSETREKLRAASLGNKGGTGHKHTEAYKLMMSELMKGNQHSKGRRLSEEHLAKLRASIPWNKGKIGLQRMSAKTKLKMSVTHKKRWAQLQSSERRMILKKRLSAKDLPNKVEKRLLKFVKHLGFRYVGDRKFWISYGKLRFNPDFVHRKKKIIIELFGRHWHNDRKIDIDRIHAYKKAGFRVLIVWDDVFNKDQKAQVARAEKAISAV